MWTQIQDALRDSVRRVLTSLATFLPGIAALLLSILVAAVVGGVVRWLVTGILRGVRFDERMERWGASAVAEWSPMRSPTLLAGRLVFWVIVLNGVLIGFAALDATLMSVMLERILTYVPNVFVAIMLVLVGGVLARFLSRGVLISAVNMQIQSARLIGLGVKWLVLLLTAAMALDHLSIGGAILKLAFGIVFGGIVLAMSLAVGLGSKEMVTRQWERQIERKPEPTSAPVSHL